MCLLREITILPRIWASSSLDDVDIDLGSVRITSAVSAYFVKFSSFFFCQGFSFGIGASPNFSYLVFFGHFIYVERCFPSQFAHLGCVVVGFLQYGPSVRLRISYTGTSCDN